MMLAKLEAKSYSVGWTFELPWWVPPLVLLTVISAAALVLWLVFRRRKQSR